MMDDVAQAAARCFEEGRDMTYILKEHGHEVCKVVRLLMPVYTPVAYPHLSESERAEREVQRWGRVKAMASPAAERALAVRASWVPGQPSC